MNTQTDPKALVASRSGNYLASPFVVQWLNADIHKFICEKHGIKPYTPLDSAVAMIAHKIARVAYAATDEFYQDSRDDAFGYLEIIQQYLDGFGLTQYEFDHIKLTVEEALTYAEEDRNKLMNE